MAASLPDLAPRRPLRLGIVGLGTVGAGVVRLLEENSALITRRAGRPVVITAVNARERSRDRGVDLSPYRWVDDAADVPMADDVDAVVELVGGSDGAALSLAQATLAAGKPFITANKAMIAHHGMALAQVADAADIPLKFEAAVARLPATSRTSALIAWEPFVSAGAVHEAPVGEVVQGIAAPSIATKSVAGATPEPASEYARSTRTRNAGSRLITTAAGAVMASVGAVVSPPPPVV